VSIQGLRLRVWFQSVHALIVQLVQLWFQCVNALIVQLTCSSSSTMRVCLCARFSAVRVWAEDMKGLDKRVRPCACALHRRAQR